MPSMTVRDILDEDVSTFDASVPVDDVIDDIRSSTSGSDRTVYYAYVVDEDDTLVGVASLRELLNAGGDQPAADAATESVVSVSADDTLDYAAKVFARNKFMAMPVVGEGSRLLGVVRASDVIEALDEDASKEVLEAMIRDVAYDPAEASDYECFSCGTIIQGVENPGTCPNCGGDLRHRRTALE